MDHVVAVPEEVFNFIEEHSGFLICGHREPDGDCVGSELALGSVLRRMGKDVWILNPGPFDRPEIAQFVDRFDEVPPAHYRGDHPAALILDCSSEDRIADLAGAIRGLPSLVIDHHASGNVFGDFRFIRPEIPATTIIVTSLIQQLKQKIRGEEAFFLFLGLVTDTGFFRFLDSGETTAFRTALTLVHAGAVPREVDFHIQSGRSFESRQLISRMLGRVERLLDGRFLLTWQSEADERELGSRKDSDALYNLLLAIEDVEAIAVVKEKEGGCTVSFRAIGGIDVGALAVEFGGGGHRRAAGGFTSQNLETFLQLLRERIQRII